MVIVQSAGQRAQVHSVLQTVRLLQVVRKFLAHLIAEKGFIQDGRTQKVSLATALLFYKMCVNSKACKKRKMAVVSRSNARLF